MLEGLRHHLARDRRRSLAAGKPLSRTSEGAVLFADIAGFTRLSSGLLERLGDARGAEELTRVLEHIYDALIAPVHEHGGSVVTFSGDAITCWFDEGDANHAGAAALAMHAAVSDLKLRPGGHPLEVGIKVGIGYGTVMRLAPGAPQWQRIDTLAGTPVVHAANAERQARVGETLLSPAAAATLSPEGRVESGIRAGYFVLQRALAPEGYLAPEPEPEPESKPEPSRQASASLGFAPFVLAGIRNALTRERARYLAEIRPVCAVFISFRGLEGASAHEVEQRLDEFVSAVQLILDGLEGVLIGVTIGDKGSYLNGAFGAPLAHEDDVVRAVAASNSILELESRFSWLTKVQIGLSHGRMRAGTFGSRTRKAYAVLGEFSNRAARLMQAAAPGELLLDEGARRSCEGAVVVEPAGELAFKGSPSAQPVFRYLSRKTRSSHSSESTPFFGRLRECAAFAEHLDRLGEGHGSLLVLEGEAGVGKSRVLQAFAELARARGFPVLAARADSLERSSPFHAWRDLLSKALNFPERSPDLAGAVALAREALPAGLDPELLPLLSPALRFRVADTPVSELLRGEARADNTLSMMAEVLAAQIPEGGAVVFAEDCHWFDSASWIVLARLRALRPQVVVVVASRPLEPDAQNPEYLKWRDTDGAQGGAKTLLELRGMSADQFDAVIAARVGADSVEPSLAANLFQRTAGHPFFGEELALALIGADLAKIDRGELTLREAGRALEDMEFPATIEGVVRARLDRLPSGADLVLKVAATLGFSFSLGALAALHPGSALEIDRALETLARNQVVEPSGGGEYVFRHAITRQVTYQQMLDDQRRDFHGKAATWYEAQPGHDRDREAPVLAHHWLGAGEASRALDYLDRAASLALEQGAYREAIDFSKRAVGLADPSSSDGQRRAYVVGSAHMGLGEVVQARSALEQALAHGGRPVPGSGLGLGFAIAGQVCGQLFHRVFPALLRREGHDPAGRERAALTLTEITPAYYLGNDIGRMFYANLRSMNLTERALTRPVARAVVAECYATSALILSATGARRSSRFYERLTRQILPQVPDPVSTGQVHMLFGLLYMGEGRCEEARSQAELACEHFGAAGHRRRYEVAAGTRAFILNYLGDYQAAVEQWSEVERLGRGRQHPQSMGLALNGRAENMLAMLDHADLTELGRVEQWVAEAGRAYPPGNDLMFDVQSAALRGEAALRGGDHPASLRHFTCAVDLIETTVPLSGYAMGSYSRVARGVHELLRHKVAARPLAARATKNLNQFARAFTLAKPAALACTGMLAAHDGKSAKAERLHRQARVLATQLKVPLALPASLEH